MALLCFFCFYKTILIKYGQTFCMESHIYFCIDLKTFYASVECAERNLDPFKTNLVVADTKRGQGTICLAITPALKNLGVRNRCRLYEIPQSIKYIAVKPRMKKYIEYSAKVYEVYLKYIASQDIHPYSIDEMFFDVTNYLKLYKMSAVTLAKTILVDVLKTTKITATCGIGTNLFLAKVALDLLAKHSKTNIAYLDEDLFKEKLWTHTPLTDFWHIGSGIQNHLSKLGIHTMKDIASADQNLLFKHFGVNAQILIDHAFGKEPTTIADIKKYQPQSESLSSSQVLFRDYTFSQAKVVLVEMIDSLCLKLVESGKVCSVVGVSVSYSKNVIKKTGMSKKLQIFTQSFKILKTEILALFEKSTNPDVPIRKIGIWFGNLLDEKYESYNLLTNKAQTKKEQQTLRAVSKIKRKFGKNSILRGVSLDADATQKFRNTLIGGHSSGEEN